MKIGIMSMQRIINYGSFLQAYGLKHILEEISGPDDDISFVDYKIETALETVSNKKSSIFIRLLKMMSPSYRKYRLEQIKLGESFSSFCQAYTMEYLPMLGICEERRECPELDLLIIGSDEVFNCTQAGNQVGFSRQLFGKDNRANRLITYAASFGSTTLKKLQQYTIQEEVACLLKGFDSLSVRDKNSIKIIETLTGQTPEYHVDPVLAYSFSEVDSIKIDLKDYIVVYAYADRLKEDEIVAIKRFAKRHNKKILTLGFWQTFADLCILANPLEVLAYIKNADYVVTDTFHGTVFSIKYQIPFVTIIRDSNRQKISDLLERFNLMNRCLEDIDELETVISAEIPADDIKQKLISEQVHSISYLKNMLF